MVPLAAAGQAVVPGPGGDDEHPPVAASHQDPLEIGNSRGECSLVNNDDFAGNVKAESWPSLLAQQKLELSKQ